MNENAVRRTVRYAAIVVLFCGIGGVIRCSQGAEEHLGSEEVIKAMHDDMMLRHAVADFMVNDHEGADDLAERLVKNPGAAGQLMDAMLRKGGVEQVFAERCARLAPQAPSALKESLPSTTGGAR